MKIRNIAGLFITTMLVTTICSGCNKNEVEVNDKYNNDKEIIEIGTKSLEGSKIKTITICLSF